MGEFERLVGAVVPAIEALIPAEPAALLGRHTGGMRLNAYPPMPTAQAALHGFPRLPAERLLGALERAVAELDLKVPDDLIAGIKPLPEGAAFGFISSDDESAMAQPMRIAEALHQGVGDLIVQQVREMLPDQTGVDGDEAAIVTKRGAEHLALAVVVSRAILNAVKVTDPAAAIGIAIGVAAEIVPGLPMPPAYERALLEKRRAEYRGSSWNTTVPVFDHGFQFVEEPSFAEPDFAATGIVTRIDTGFAVRTGIEQGNVPVSVRVTLDGPGEPDLAHWDEVAEVGFTAVRGDARFGHGGMPPWPGEFRVRVHAIGRDGDDDESYHLLIWAAPHAEPLVLKKTDRVGHLLRGEPEPAPRVFPEAGLRWLPALLGEAATVTVITGLGVDDVVDHFEEDSIAVEIDGGVVVVEVNNYVGTDDEVLELLSRNGRAASYFWNVNRSTLLSFARDGHPITSAEPWEDADFGDDQEVLEALEGLDFGGRNRDAKGITAVARFTGAVIPEADVRAAIQELFSSWEG